MAGIDIDLADGVSVTGYQRHGSGHGFKISWPWPDRVRCPRCRHDDPAHLERHVVGRQFGELDADPAAE
jgi:hypothetical protein